MDAFLQRAAAIVGASFVIAEPAEQEPYVIDWLHKYRGSARAIIRPGSTEEVAAVVRLCREARIAIVPQGGNTGMAGGATPDLAGEQIVLNLGRLNRIRDVDAIANTITAEAGCVLAAIQEAARGAGRYFPLSLGAEGSCTIGGNLATNAGGVAVLRYGNMRELTLGLEVVLPDGRIWDGLRSLRKDNTGYDLRDLFIGSEGTLGIVTGAVLKLFALPTARASAMVALHAPADALPLLSHMRERCGDRLTAFEFMTEACLDLVIRHIDGASLPFGKIPRAVALIELSDTGETREMLEKLEHTLGDAFEAGLVADAAIAQNEQQVKAFWRLREGISEAQLREGKTIKHDISIPIGRMMAFAEEANAAVEKAFPGIRFIVFGHLGDGNLHYNLMRAPSMTDAEFVGLTPQVNRIVHDIVHAYRGSISAEHGIGQLRRDELAVYKSPIELGLMRDIKKLLDPAGILNPGKLL